MYFKKHENMLENGEKDLIRLHRTLKWYLDSIGSKTVAARTKSACTKVTNLPAIFVLHNSCMLMRYLWMV
jgi:hypothetical protein